MAKGHDTGLSSGGAEGASDHSHRDALGVQRMDGCAYDGTRGVAALTGYLVEYHDGAELFTLLGETYVPANPQTVLA